MAQFCVHIKLGYRKLLKGTPWSHRADNFCYLHMQKKYLQVQLYSTLFDQQKQIQEFKSQLSVRSITWAGQKGSVAAFNTAQAG